MSIAEAWRRIEAWRAAHLPDRTLGLRDGASEAAIADAEAKLGVRFPDDFRESLAIHDGQDAPTFCPWPFAERLGPLASIVAGWESDRPAWDPADPEGRFDWLDQGKRVRQVHFHPKQIAIAGSEHWDYDRLLLDYLPGPSGREAQVIARADIELAFLCDTFGGLLDTIAGGLERGTIVPDDDGDRVFVTFRSPRAGKSMNAVKYFARPGKLT